MLSEQPVMRASDADPERGISVSSAFPTRLDVCRDWLNDAHRALTRRLFRSLGNEVPAARPMLPDAPTNIVVVPRSQPECAHSVDPRLLAHIGIVAALARESWFMQEIAIETSLGPTGRLQLRQRSEWVIGPPAIRCAGLRSRKDPECVVTATAEVPLESYAPRVLNCVICYDDARIAA